MPGIIYPPDTAPFIPARDVLSDVRASEVLPVVEPTGMVIGRSSRAYCHGGTKPLHPVVHLHVYNRFGLLYLQKRSMTKDLLPGFWDTAVGGHVSYGESIEEALFREAGEELGLVDFNPIFLDSYLWESATERELVFSFAAIGDFHPAPDNSEVDDGRFWSAGEIERAMSTGQLTPNFENEYRRIRSRLEALL